MNKEELLQELAKKSSVTKKKAGIILDSLIDTVQTVVARGDKLTLIGFGSFEKRQRQARNGRNPQTGKTIRIAAKKVPVFSAGKTFKEMVK